MDRIRCFWLSPAPRAQVSYRRFTFSGEGTCPGRQWGHDASAVVGTVDLPLDACGSGDIPDDGVKADHRWPMACSHCGYLFSPSDHWQVNVNRLYSRSDGGPDTILGTAPAGAMWDAEWMGDRFKGADGRCLVVRTPGGDWTVDGPASNGPGWTRSGDPPDVTASPSIVAGAYHGWLRDGWLVRC